jgi:hypothetical protein
MRHAQPPVARKASALTRHSLIAAEQNAGRWRRPAAARLRALKRTHNARPDRLLHRFTICLRRTGIVVDAGTARDG